MRIISKFKDYYDGVMSYGQDMSVVLERNTDILSKSNCDFFEKLGFMHPELRAYESNCRVDGSQYSISPFKIAFCGLIYSGIEVSAASNRRAYDTEVSFHYDAESYVNRLLEIGAAIADDKRRKYMRRLYHYSSCTNAEDIKNYFSRQGEKSKFDFFADASLPLLACYSRAWNRGELEIEKNPRLSDVCFYKVVDAFSAYQELSMFTSGVMSKAENNVVVISDDIKKIQKGFDDYSFKKLPSKRKSTEPNR